MEADNDDIFDNRKWELKYYGYIISKKGKKSMVWISIMTITPDTNFSEIMDTIHRLNIKHLGLRIFEIGGTKRFNHNIYIADGKTAKKAAKADEDSE